MKQAKSILDQFSTLKCPILEDVLICGLGSYFWPFTHAIVARNNLISFDDLYVEPKNSTSNRLAHCASISQACDSSN